MRSPITVSLPEGTVLSVKNSCLEISGSLGTVRLEIKAWTPSTHNLYKSLIANAIQGVSTGFLQKLKIQGGGYRAVSVDKHSLVLRLGYSHDISVNVPAGIHVRINKYNQILCVGNDKQSLAQFCSKLKHLREYNIYKQKGIFSVGAVLPLKAPGKPGRM